MGLLNWLLFITGDLLKGFALFILLILLLFKGGSFLTIVILALSGDLLLLNWGCFVKGLKLIWLFWN
jgi:hypothetical protein